MSNEHLEIEQRESYYKDQLSKINCNGMYSPSFQFRDEDGQTKWMNLNQDSATILIKWLKQNFNLR